MTISVTVCQATFTSNPAPPNGFVFITQKTDPAATGAVLATPTLTRPSGNCNSGSYTTSFPSAGRYFIQADDADPQVPGTCGNANDFGVRTTTTLPNYNSGCNSYTQIVTEATAPAAPANVQATALDSTRVRLDWTNSSSNVDSIQILDAIGGAVIKTVAGNATSSVLVNLDPVSEYCVVLIAVNQAGSSSTSNQSCANTPG